MPIMPLHPLDKIEIFTLLDNYTDLTVMDNNDVITRGGYPQYGGLKQPLRAEHGFSLLIHTCRGSEVRSMVFDGGFSPAGAVQNVNKLGLNLKDVESFVLSHGHADHWGGLIRLVKATGRNRMPLVVHPDAFRRFRHSLNKSLIYYMPPLTRRRFANAGFYLQETRAPSLILQGNVLFLGEVPRIHDFEKNESDSYYRENGVTKRDDFSDDSAIAMMLKGKGLIIVTGCAHAGIINTIDQAIRLTGEKRIFAIMGGFHLTGKTKAQILPILDALRRYNPCYVVPCHCTGRKAAWWIEEAMPEAFLLNMSGTKFTFHGCDERDC